MKNNKPMPSLWQLAAISAITQFHQPHQSTHRAAVRAALLQMITSNTQASLPTFTTGQLYQLTMAIFNLPLQPDQMTVYHNLNHASFYAKRTDQLALRAKLMQLCQLRSRMDERIHNDLFTAISTTLQFEIDSSTCSPGIIGKIDEMIAELVHPGANIVGLSARKTLVQLMLHYPLLTSRVQRGWEIHCLSAIQALVYQQTGITALAPRHQDHFATEKLLLSGKHGLYKHEIVTLFSSHFNHAFEHQLSQAYQLLKKLKMQFSTARTIEEYPHLVNNPRATLNQLLRKIHYLDRFHNNTIDDNLTLHHYLKMSQDSQTFSCHINKFHHTLSLLKIKNLMWADITNIYDHIAHFLTHHPQHDPNITCLVILALLNQTKSAPFSLQQTHIGLNVLTGDKLISLASLLKKMHKETQNYITVLSMWLTAIIWSAQCLFIKTPPGESDKKTVIAALLATALRLWIARIFIREQDVVEFISSAINPVKQNLFRLSYIIHQSHRPLIRPSHIDEDNYFSISHPKQVLTGLICIWLTFFSIGASTPTNTSGYKALTIAMVLSLYYTGGYISRRKRGIASMPLTLAQTIQVIEQNQISDSFTKLINTMVTRKHLDEVRQSVRSTQHHDDTSVTHGL